MKNLEIEKIVTEAIELINLEIDNMEPVGESESAEFYLTVCISCHRYIALLDSGVCKRCYDDYMGDERA